MNNTLTRASAILLHVITNFFLLSWIVDFDLTGGWLRFGLFLLVCLALLCLFVVHIVSFIRFLQSK